ncbi:MAG TPA: YbaY family lipoprotein [bacterium]|nr:YbaY family lipoprotein [bacterium]
MKFTARKAWAAPGIVLIAGLWIGCASNPLSSGSSNAVEGTVTYREQVALPPLAVVEVKILDSASNPTSEYLAATTIRTEGRQVPISFALPYDPAKIQPTHTYVVHAAIGDGAKTLFTTNTIYPVITKGNPKDVDVVLTKVGDVDEAQEAGTLVGTSWKLQDLQGKRVLNQVEATLSFPEAGLVAGNATCNSFFGTVQVKGQSMKFGPIGSTKMACADSIMDQETKYLQALHKVEKFTIQEPEHILVLELDGTSDALRFERTSP